MAKVYVIIDAAREYWTGRRWTPAGDEAAEYETREEAIQALEDSGRATDRVLARDVD